MTMTQWCDDDNAGVKHLRAKHRQPAPQPPQKGNGSMVYSEDEALQLATKNSIDDQMSITAKVTCPMCNATYTLDGVNMKFDDAFVSDNYIMSQGMNDCFDIDNKFRTL